MRKLLLALGLCLLPGVAFAQMPVVTEPLGVTTLVSTSTISVTNTFQTLASQSPTGAGGAGGRNGCTVINEGTHTMYVYFGPATSASTAGSIPLPAISGSVVPVVTCGLPSGAVRQDQVNVTGTAGDAYYFDRE